MSPIHPPSDGPSPGRLYAAVDCGHSAIKAAWVRVTGSWTQEDWPQARVLPPVPPPVLLRDEGLILRPSDQNDADPVADSQALNRLSGLVTDLIQALASSDHRLQGLVLAVPAGWRPGLLESLEAQEDLKCLPWCVLSPLDSWPVHNGYGTAATVGPDRLAAVTAAVARQGGRGPAIVVTAGTAITVNGVASDLENSGPDLNRRPTFLGGTILPGYRAFLQSLGQAAPTLAPAVDQVLAHGDWLDRDFEQRHPDLAGSTTPGNLRRGALEGVAGAVSQNVRLVERTLGLREASEADAEPLWITGGDAAVLAHGLGEMGLPATRTLEVVPSLVLEGMALALDRMLALTNETEPIR